MKRSVIKQVAELQHLDIAELKDRWRVLYGTEPPGYNRAHLIKRLAYRIQELAYGGLSEVTRARLREHLNGERLDTDTAEVARMERRKRKNGMPVAGTRLIREWQGRRYEVTVVHGGFEYDGRRYRSLTAVADKITSSHRSGLAFFGLRKPEKKRGD